MVFRCPNCGGEIKFNAETQRMHCDFCDTDMSVADFKALKNKQREQNEKDAYNNPGEFYDVHEFVCSQCGASIISTDTTVATFCSYCGSPTVLESRVTKEKKPDYVIPFSQTKEDCVNRYKQYIHRMPFAPKWLTENAEIERFRGIYMPYWVYSFSENDLLRIKGSKEHRKGNYVYTDHYVLNRNIDGEIKGIHFDAAMSFSDNLSNAIAPYDVKQADSFNPNYLSGFYADSNDVGSWIYEDDAKEIAERYFVDSIPEKSKYAQYNVGNEDIKKSLKVETVTQKGLFPVWFLSVRPKNKEKVCYAAVNGQSGKVAADIPIDYGKFLIGSVILAAIFFILFNFVFTFTPIKVLVITLFLAVISIICSNIQLKQIYARKQHLDDAGFISKKSSVYQNMKSAGGKKAGSTAVVLFIIVIVFLIYAVSKIFIGGEGKALLAFLPVVGILVLKFVINLFIKQIGKTGNPKAQKNEAQIIRAQDTLAVLIKPVISIIVGIAVLIWNPVYDIYYYSAVAANLIMIAWSYFDLARGHNELCERELPQFNIRGGEQYE